MPSRDNAPKILVRQGFHRFQLSMILLWDFVQRWQAVLDDFHQSLGHRLVQSPGSAFDPSETAFLATPRRQNEQS